MKNINYVQFILPYHREFKFLENYKSNVINFNILLYGF